MRLLIAYNNDSADGDATHFAFCGEEMEIEADVRKIDKVVLTPPEMTHAHLIEYMPTCQVCFVASHGDAKSIANEKNEDLVSVRYDNSVFSGKMLYAVSCYCGTELKDHLVQIGLRSFWGFEKELKFWGGYPQYSQSALAGIKSLLDGKNLKEAKTLMLAKYDEGVAELEKVIDNPLLAADLYDDKEALVVYGDEDFVLTDLEESVFDNL